MPIVADRHEILSRAFEKLDTKAPEASVETSPTPSSAEATGASAPDASPSLTPTHPEAPIGDGQAAAAGAEDQPLFNWDEIKDADERVVRLAKQLQGDYTKKSQALAEQRKTIDAQASFEQNLPQEVREFNERWRLAWQMDPTGNLASQLIANVHQALAPANPAPNPAQAPSAPPFAPAPAAQYDQYGYPVTPDPQVAQYQQEVARLSAEKAQLEQHQKVDLLIRQANMEFDKLEQKHGITIPKSERELTAIWSIQQGFPNPWMGWEYQNLERVRQAQVEKARKEAADITTQKLAMSPGPSTIPSRATATEEIPKGRRALIQYHYDKLARG